MDDKIIIMFKKSNDAKEIELRNQYGQAFKVLPESRLSQGTYQGRENASGSWNQKWNNNILR